MSSLPRMQRVNVSIMNETPHVDNQREEGICYAMAIADMVGTCYRMQAKKQGRRPIPLTLYPQPLIDLGCQDDAFDILKNPMYGLQRVDDYPFTRYRNNDGPRYRDGAPRFGVRRGEVLHLSTNGVERMVAHNFGQNGRGWPIVASIKMGELADPSIAKDAFTFRTPFRHDQTDDQYMDSVRAETSHAVLVVGINNTSPDPKDRYLIIKNSWGLEWGENGYSIIGFEVVEELHIVYQL